MIHHIRGVSSSVVVQDVETTIRGYGELGEVLGGAVRPAGVIYPFRRAERDASVVGGPYHDVRVAEPAIVKADINAPP